jgi:mRNA-degrading endonuclease RelE of RelBE toxin-antitoxin system
MNFSVIPSDKFKKEAKRLTKKYPSLKKELADLATTLTTDPEIGTPLGSNTYKIRIAIKSKGKGKSGLTDDAKREVPKSLVETNTRNF